jgi:hypothetical protein
MNGMLSAKATVFFELQLRLLLLLIARRGIISAVALRTRQRDDFSHELSPENQLQNACGAHDQNRTGDHMLTMHVLYRLSYVGLERQKCTHLSLAHLIQKYLFILEDQ